MIKTWRMCMRALSVHGHGVCVCVSVCASRTKSTVEHNERQSSCPAAAPHFLATPFAMDLLSLHFYPAHQVNCPRSPLFLPNFRCQFALSVTRSELPVADNRNGNRNRYRNRLSKNRGFFTLIHID